MREDIEGNEGTKEADKELKERETKTTGRQGGDREEREKGEGRREGTTEGGEGDGGRDRLKEGIRDVGRGLRRYWRCS